MHIEPTPAQAGAPQLQAVESDSMWEPKPVVPQQTAVLVPSSTTGVSDISSGNTSHFKVAGGDSDVSLEDLDMSEKDEQKAFRLSDLSKPASTQDIYFRHLYPSGHGYPCVNPQPKGQPIRIGDVGVFTSYGFIALENLYECQSTSLRDLLSSLPPLSEVVRDTEYFKEGDFVTGGVCEIEVLHATESSTIDEIRCRWEDSEGAILAITSSAELLTLKDTIPLRNWLRDNAKGLFQSLRPQLDKGLVVVTGTVKSSSWAIATFSEPMHAPHDLLVLSNFTHRDPNSQSSYRWTRTGNAQARSRASAVIDDTGERAKDQCLFLRGFSLTGTGDLWDLSFGN